MVSLNVIRGSLKTDRVPSGIISFELAGGLSRAQPMVESWGPIGQVCAGFSLGLDNLFLVAYAGSTASGCVLTARNLPQWIGFFSTVGVLLAWALLGAALNFLIVVAGLIYIAIGVLITMVAKAGKGEDQAS